MGMVRHYHPRMQTISIIVEVLHEKFGDPRICEPAGSVAAVEMTGQRVTESDRNKLRYLAAIEMRQESSIVPAKLGL